jgi:hypothetical protein
MQEKGNLCIAQKWFNIDAATSNDGEVLKFASESPDHGGHEDENGYLRYPGTEPVLATSLLRYRHGHHKDALVCLSSFFLFL